MNQSYSIWKSILSISMNYPILPYFSKTTQQLSIEQEKELQRVSPNTQSQYLNQICIYYANYKHVSHQVKQNKLQFLKDRLRFQQPQPQPQPQSQPQQSPQSQSSSTVQTISRTSHYQSPYENFIDSWEQRWIQYQQELRQQRQQRQSRTTELFRRYLFGKAKNAYYQSKYYQLLLIAKIVKISLKKLHWKDQYLLNEEITQLITKRKQLIQNPLSNYHLLSDSQKKILIQNNLSFKYK